MATEDTKTSLAGFQLKTPKGTRDWILPVFELKEILAEKYGEDARLIYDLNDQGGEICSLRFDLTLPFARWLAMNNFTQIKRYQIAKVYRRDQPAIACGRLREFYRCDFDIAGNYDSMIHDAEILRIIVELFAALRLDVTIKINHRQILDSCLRLQTKLDKMSLAEVKREMVQEKGLMDKVADQICEYIGRSGNVGDMLEFLKSNSGLSANENVKAGLDDMTLLASYLEAFNISDKVEGDLSLARGLDYYSGLIFEVITKSNSRNQSSQIGVGSIAAGGRYNNLAGMYKKSTIPCIGVMPLLTHNIDVYIMTFGGKDSDGLLLERMKVARQLWDAGIRAEFAPKVKPKLPQQFKAAKDVPLTVILGHDEPATGQVRLKIFSTGNDEKNGKDQGQLVSIKNVVEEVRKLLRTAIYA
ncbi:hypothetical protein OIDMADRAFT_36974 [Oidiodendron maius Zn]|uniref:histidine--tRNA ligase n=1 Tax=Oidiodendron maius (strain Zn) TaxID=913774 RepID=A0A0C3D805_OIDMZ|nr:hypothetical protein OIDMADRAFT_36974 [Oidiodendron maius Zn]